MHARTSSFVDSRLLHSPRLAAVGILVGMLVMAFWHRPFVIGWSKYRLGYPQSQWIVGSFKRWDYLPFFRGGTICRFSVRTDPHQTFCLRCPIPVDTLRNNDVVITSIPTSFWRNYVKMTSVWGYNNVVITSCVQWDGCECCHWSTALGRCPFWSHTESNIFFDTFFTHICMESLLR